MIIQDASQREVVEQKVVRFHDVVPFAHLLNVLGSVVPSLRAGECMISIKSKMGLFIKRNATKRVTASLALSDCLVASSPSFVKDRMLVRRFASATKSQESLGNVGKYTYPNATTVKVCFQKQVASAIRKKSSFLQICIQGNGMTCSPKTPSGIQITIP